MMQNRATPVKINLQMHQLRMETFRTNKRAEDLLQRNIGEVYAHAVDNERASNPTSIIGFIQYMRHRGLNAKSAMLVVLGHYDVELTPRELILEKCREHEERAVTTPRVSDQWYSKGYKDAVKEVDELFDLGIYKKTVMKL